MLIGCGGNMLKEAQQHNASEVIASRQLLRMVQQSMSEQHEQRREIHTMQQNIQTLTAAVVAALPHIGQHVPHSVPPPAVPLWEQACVRSAVSSMLIQRNVPVPIGLTNALGQSITSPPPADTRPTPPPLPSIPLRLTTHSVMIGHQRIHYDQDRLVAPPRRDYSANPELLADDWEHLEILLCPDQCEDIGVKYWKQIYKGTVHWTHLRKYYSIWRVRVHNECILSAAERSVLMLF